MAKGTSAREAGAGGWGAVSAGGGGRGGPVGPGLARSNGCHRGGGWRSTDPAFGPSLEGLEAHSGMHPLTGGGLASGDAPSCPWGSSHLHGSPVWQHPFLNVFRHFKVGEWKRSTKEGDVAPVTVSGHGDLAAAVETPSVLLRNLSEPPQGHADGALLGVPRWTVLPLLFLFRIRL